MSNEQSPISNGQRVTNGEQKAKYNVHAVYLLLLLPFLYSFCQSFKECLPFYRELYCNKYVINFGIKNKKDCCFVFLFEIIAKGIRHILCRIIDIHLSSNNSEWVLLGVIFENHWEIYHLINIFCVYSRTVIFKMCLFLKCVFCVYCFRISEVFNLSFKQLFGEIQVKLVWVPNHQKLLILTYMLFFDTTIIMNGIKILFEQMFILIAKD